jgi:hypothetical protein
MCRRITACARVRRGGQIRQRRLDPLEPRVIRATELLVHWAECLRVEQIIAIARLQKIAKSRLHADTRSRHSRRVDPQAG